MVPQVPAIRIDSTIKGIRYPSICSTQDSTLQMNQSACVAFKGVAVAELRLKYHQVAGADGIDEASK